MRGAGGLVLAVLIVVGLSPAAGATGAASGSSRGWTLAAYICADGDLRRLGEAYARGLEEGVRSGGWTLALQIDRGAGAESGPLRRLISGGDEALTERVAGAQAPNAGRSENLAEFLGWVHERAPGTRLGLIVFGHGTSPIGLGGDGAAACEAAVAFDAEFGDALTAREVAEALAAVEMRADLLVLDCCFGCSADAAWELRERVGVLVASPGRVPGSGLPWRAILSASGPEGLTTEALAQRCLDAVGGRNGDEGLTALRCARLDELAGAVRRLCAAITAQPGVGMVALAVARRMCRDLGARRELCDLRELCARLRDGESVKVGEAAMGVADAIDGCVLGRTGGGVTGGGLTVLMPGGVMGVAEDYGARAEGFGGASGWGELVHGYVRSLQDLMRRTTGDPRRGEEAA